MINIYKDGTYSCFKNYSDKCYNNFLKNNKRNKFL